MVPLGYRPVSKGFITQTTQYGPVGLLTSYKKNHFVNTTDIVPLGYGS